jgi:type IV pilus assembly protein PilW
MKQHTVMNQKGFSQKGFSLIELLVGIAVSLVLIAIASSIFVGGVRSSRAQEERSKQTETAQLVMELLGRNIRQAGFFPAVNPGQESDAKEIQSQVGFIKQGFPPNIVNLAFPAFNNSFYACADARYDRATGQCLSAGNTPNSDTLIVNYFSDDSFPQTANSFPGPGSGTRFDCLGSSVDGLAHNSTASGNFSPVLVTNIYSLGVTRTYEVSAGKSVTTRSFGCTSLVNAANHQPFFEGVEQIRYRFGLIETGTFQAPIRYYTVAEMNALPLATVNGNPNMSSWSRIVSIEVCLQTRSFEANAREAASATTTLDCDGNAITGATANQPRPIVAINREIFNVRNSAGVTL